MEERPCTSAPISNGGFSSIASEIPSTSTILNRLDHLRLLQEKNKNENKEIVGRRRCKHCRGVHEADAEVCTLNKYDLTTDSTPASKTVSSFEKAVMCELRSRYWYWGSISARNANRLLKNHSVGTFLVRDSYSESCIFSVSYVTEHGIFHSRLARFNGNFCLGGPNALIRSTSLVDFIEQAVRSSSDENQSLRILMHNSSMEPAAQQISLRYPLCRTKYLASLKYYCRLVIRNALADSGESIESLPLPKKLKRFVGSPTYLLIC